MRPPSPRPAESPSLSRKPPWLQLQDLLLLFPTTGKSSSLECVLLGEPLCVLRSPIQESSPGAPPSTQLILSQRLRAPASLCAPCRPRAPPLCHPNIYEPAEPGFGVGAQSHTGPPRGARDLGTFINLCASRSSARSSARGALGPGLARRPLQDTQVGVRGAVARSR